MSEPQANDLLIQDAVQRILDGGLVAFPTETVYGLGANALDPKAVQRIFEVKGRPSSNPLIVHIATVDEIGTVANLETTPRLKERINALSKFWPGPLTLVLPSNGRCATGVSAGQASIAVRIPNHPVALKLLRAAGVPIAAPSANRSTEISPTKAEHVRESLGGSVDLILDGGACQIGVESTILSLLSEPPTILRPGAVTIEQLRETLGRVDILERRLESSSSTQSGVVVPGMFRRHYAPHTPVCFIDQLPSNFAQLRVGLIRFSTQTDDLGAKLPYTACEVLSSSGDLDEVATQLFGALHKLDKLKLDLIVVERCPEMGIGRAIMDRLRRATEKE